MVKFFFLTFFLLMSSELTAGVSIRIKGKIVSYTDTYIKMNSGGKIEVIPMEYVHPLLKNELHKRMNQEITIRLPEYVLKKTEN